MSTDIYHKLPYLRDQDPHGVLVSPRQTSAVTVTSICHGVYYMVGSPPIVNVTETKAITGIAILRLPAKESHIGEVCSPKRPVVDIEPIVVSRKCKYRWYNHSKYTHSEV